MKYSLPILVAVVIFVFTTSNSNGTESAIAASEQERTFTGFYFPTGTANLGNFAGWLADGCPWSGNNTYTEGFYHIGQDIDANEGASVYAIADGEVVHLSTSGWGTGNIGVLAEHQLIDGTKFIAVYGHVRSNVAIGDDVEAGKAFGTIGPLSPPHLHFGIRPGPQIVDPFGRLPCPSEGPLSKLAENTNGYVDPIDWIKTNNPKLETPIPDTVDVVLIIDSSGSMTVNDPNNKRLDAAKAYLTGSFAGDFVGVVDFDGSVRTASPLRRLPDNKDILKSAIDTINSSGGTNIGIGVQRGCDELVSSPSENVKKAAILLTNGIGTFAEQHACFFTSRGWPIYTFGLGSGADHPLLERIAANTGGEHTELPASELICEFQRVRSKIAGVEPPPCTVIRVFALEFTTFFVRVESGQLQISFSYSWLGSDVEMSLITPSGRVIDRDTVAPDVQHDQGDTFEVYTVENPEAGDWEVQLFGADVPEEGEEGVFSFTSIPSPNRPPSADAGPDQSLECASPAGAAATLDGTGSSDPDGDSLSFSWADTGIVFDDPTSPTPSVTFPLGTTTVSLTVTDPGGLSDTDTTDITVVDTTPPTLTVTGNQSLLWPPEHQYEPIDLSVEVSDVCDTAPMVTAVAESSEADDANGNGDGATTGDIKVTTADGAILLSSNDSPTVTFDPVNDHLELRAERAGVSGGRTYTIEFTATDAGGNQATATTTVNVPLDQRDR